MADVKITQLPAALSVNDTDNLILDDGSSTYRVAADLLKAYMISDIPADIDAAVTAANENLAPAYNASSTYAVGDLVTYSGKLYKCIVAVTSPEAFNIIKWDNVTTSEVYDSKPKILYENVLSMATTYSDILNNIYSNLSDIAASAINDLTLVIIAPSNLYSRVFICDEIGVGDILKFSRVNFTKAGSLMIDAIGIYRDATVVYNSSYIPVGSDVSVSNTSKLTDTEPSGTIIRIIQS